jgi:hypothetical protein
LFDLCWFRDLTPHFSTRVFHCVLPQLFLFIVMSCCFRSWESFVSVFRSVFESGPSSMIARFLFLWCFGVQTLCLSKCPSVLLLSCLGLPRSRILIFRSVRVFRTRCLVSLFCRLGLRSRCPSTHASVPGPVPPCSCLGFFVFHLALAFGVAFLVELFGFLGFGFRLPLHFLFHCCCFSSFAPALVVLGAP